MKQSLLTKEEKMEIVSKAIDEGFDVSLNFHKAKSFEHAVSVLDVVIPNLDTDILGAHNVETSWIQYDNYENKLEVTTFFDRVEVLPND